VLDATGKALHLEPFHVRLHALSAKKGMPSIDCGTSDSRRPSAKAAECAKTAFRRHKSFVVEYLTRSGDFIHSGYGLTGDSEGNVWMATYDSRKFPDVRPTRRTQLLDGNRVRLEPCVPPVELGLTDDGEIACLTPVNKDASARAAQQLPIETSICTIAENPAAFNNQLVRIRGYAEGNFEFSMITAEGCSKSLWFTYGSSSESVPGLAAYVPGIATTGAEDERGYRILPVPAELVHDQNFDRFQSLMQESYKTGSDSLSVKRVTATFLGRIDAVSSEVHQFHSTQREKSMKGPDGLGFGHMGMFDAQFVMKSVEGDAVLEVVKR